MIFQKEVVTTGSPLIRPGSGNSERQRGIVSSLDHEYNPGQVIMLPRHSDSWSIVTLGYFGWVSWTLWSVWPPPATGIQEWLSWLGLKFMMCWTEGPPMPLQPLALSVKSGQGHLLGFLLKCCFLENSDSRQVLNLGWKHLGFCFRLSCSECENEHIFMVKF